MCRPRANVSPVFLAAAGPPRSARGVQRTRRSPNVRTTASVPSVEASSTTSTSMSRTVCERALVTARPTKAARSWVGMTTDTNGGDCAPVEPPVARSRAGRGECSPQLPREPSALQSGPVLDTWSVGVR